MKPQFLPGNTLTLLQSGAEYFPALRAAIDAASEEIYLESYIFEPDATGREFVSALAQAASRGVRVRVIVDGFGSSAFTGSLAAALQRAGVAVLVYRPERALFSLRARRLRRLHRKLAVIDSRVAFVGGINLIDDFDPPGSTVPRLDYAVRIEGPVLQKIHDAARKLWELVAWASFKRRLALDVPRWQGEAGEGGVRAAFLVRDNIRHRRDIEAAYIQAMRGATREILIANAYFLPGRHFRAAMLAAAARGVAVTVLLQGRVEYWLQHYATQALYGELMAGGVRIIEYDASYLHAKVAVIDARWATVGSSNIDPFSLLLAREANLVVDDEGFATALRSRLLAQIAAHGRVLAPQAWARRSIFARVMNRLAYALLRFCIGVAGYRGEH
ncbi:MAG: cardiolipin synthase ClsB [Pseudomonadota bacterium]